jgi:hypothetical protein
VSCSHDGFHSFLSQYDSDRGELVYFWVCEGCMTRLDEARREVYRPRFDPNGNDGYRSRTSGS